MKLKRALSALLLAAMLVITACGGTTPPVSDAPSATQAATAASAPTAAPEEVKNFNETGYPIVNDKITLRAFQWELGLQVDFPELWFYQELEAKTNIHVEFEEVKDEDWKTKLNLMFASGDYSDIIIQGDVDVEEYGVTQGILVPLDDYLPAYMPIYYERLQLNDANAAIPASNGKSYFVGFIMAQNINTNGHWFINKTWLDTLGLSIPTTIDELTDVFYAFKNDDPNGNGQADEIPYMATFYNTNAGLYNAFMSWGIPMNVNYIFIDDADKIQYAAHQDGFRPCLEWLNKIYSEGLLDQESLTIDESQRNVKINQGIGGYFTYWRLLNTDFYPEIREQYECVLPPSADGYKSVISATLEVADFGAAVTIANENVEATLRWLDAQMETETMMQASNGKLGDTLAVNENGKYEVVYVPENNGLYEIVPVICGQFFAPGDYYFDVYEMAPHRVEKYSYCNWYSEEGYMENKSYQYATKLSKMNSEDSTELTKLYTEIDKYMQEAITAFITQGVTDAAWDAFMKTLDGLKVEEYVQLYQKAYDGYIAAN